MWTSKLSQPLSQQLSQPAARGHACGLQCMRWEPQHRTISASSLLSPIEKISYPWSEASRCASSCMMITGLSGHHLGVTKGSELNFNPQCSPHKYPHMMRPTKCWLPNVQFLNGTYGTGPDTLDRALYRSVSCNPRESSIYIPHNSGGKS